MHIVTIPKEITRLRQAFGCANVFVFYALRGQRKSQLAVNIRLDALRNGAKPFGHVEVTRQVVDNEDTKTLLFDKEVSVVFYKQRGVAELIIKGQVVMTKEIKEDSDIDELIREAEYHVIAII